MAKNLQLSIPEPCHENWEHMTPTDKGRFCAACQKDVVDFTNMSNAALIAFFRKKTTGSVCGRFYNDQLDTAIPIPTKRIPWAKYFFQITLPAFIASGKLMAQGQVVPQYKDTKGKTVIVAGGVKKRSADPVRVTTVKGQVKDEQGNGIPYASLINTRTKAGITADDLGYFVLQDVDVSTGGTYTISAVGYADTTIFASPINQKTPLVVQLIAANTLEEIVLIANAQTIERRSSTGVVMTTTVGAILSSIKPLPPITKKVAPIHTVDEQLTITPNPVVVNKTITIHFNSVTAGKYHYSIVSMDGKLIVSGIKDCLEGLNTITQLINSRYTTGTYILLIQNEQQTVKQSRKFIVQR
jgi:hypothetical protein